MNVVHERSIHMAASAVALVVFTGVLVAEVCEARPLPRRYATVQSYGMGGATLTIGLPLNAIYANPATLHLDESRDQAGFFNPQVAAARDSVRFLSDLDSVEGGDEDEIAELLAANVGTPHYLSAAVAPFGSISRVSFAIRADVETSAMIRNRAAPRLELILTQDIEANLATSIDVLDDTLSMGASLYATRRQGVDRTYSVPELADDDFDLQDELRTESGIGLDVGVLWRPYGPPTEASEQAGALPAESGSGGFGDLDPRVGAVLQGMGDRDFAGIDPEPFRVNVGASIHPAFWNIQTTLAMTYVGLVESGDGKQDTDIGKRLHVGANLSLPSILSVQLGLYQGWPTAGVTLDMGYLRLGYATYAEEFGPEAGDLDDRRHVVTVSIEAP